MARNGSGTYTLPAGQPVVTLTTISSTTFNTLTSDLATALTNSLAANGETPCTARIPFANGISVVGDITTSSASFVAFAGATTLLTIGGTGASASMFVPSTLDSTSSTTGAIRTSGGISAAKALWVGTTANIAGATTLGGALIGAATQSVFNTVSTTVNFAGGASTALNIGNASGTTTALGNWSIGGTLDVAGNTTVGGLTASAWSTGKALEVGNVGNGIYSVNAQDMRFISNYYNNSGDKFAGTGYAALYQIGSGEHNFYTSSASGTAGNAATMVLKMTISAAGIVTMGAYGAGTATFSAAGVISSVSDERLKIKDGAPADPIAMLTALTPGYYYWKDKEQRGEQRELGHYAQNVHAAIGEEAAPTPIGDKPWGYYDRSVAAVHTLALQNHESRLAALEAKLA